MTKRKFTYQKNNRKEIIIDSRALQKVQKKI